MTCECKVCEYGKLVEQNINILPEPQRKFFNDMYSNLAHAEEDRDYYKAIVKGTWPNADGIIALMRRVKEVKNENLPTR
ncbi:MAG: hypothetical protein JRI26_11490 [Deltaproteobacteria bacterium]|nr:hypothetical protein [Deltaproteobacteria bacterium]